MKDFEGKILKVYFNNAEGLVCLKSRYIRFEEGFFVLQDYASKRIRYINKDYIRSIEILGEINEES